jgi:hypothetical protein
MAGGGGGIKMTTEEQNEILKMAVTFFYLVFKCLLG